MAKERNPFSNCRDLVSAARKLSDLVDKLEFSEPVTHVYNPLSYARRSHERYLVRCAQGPVETLYLGMNPGPWGMAQTGIPFGEVRAVREFLGIDCVVSKPAIEHPKRPIEGLACKRSEVSGARLWQLFADRYQTADRFLATNLVLNYCPLVFMESSGKNRTPDKLRASESEPLHRCCDGHLQRVIEIVKPRFLVGVGAFAYDCLVRVLEQARAAAGANADLSACAVHKILHPSPASPAANKDWAGTATKQLVQAGVWRST